MTHTIRESSVSLAPHSLCKKMLAIWLLILLSACGSSSSPSVDPGDENTQPGNGQQTPITAGPSGFSEERMARGTVQDLWTLQSLEAIDETGESQQLIKRLVELYEADAEAPVELSPISSFRAIPVLSPVIVDGSGAVREHITVVAGLLDVPDGTTIAVLATPDVTKGGLIDEDDILRLDITRLESELPVGTALVADYYFAVTVPHETEVETSTGVDLMLSRMADDRLIIQSGSNEADARPLLLEGNIGVTTQGSLGGGIPAKAAPLICGLLGGGPGGGPGGGCSGVGQLVDAIGPVSVVCLTEDLGEIYNNARLSNDALNSNFDSNVGTGGRGQCDCPPNSLCSTIFNDPHVRTLDGRAYSPQAVGEFTGLLYTAGGTANELQMRFEPVVGNTTVSYVTALAWQIGSTRITLDPNRETMLHINGEPKPFNIDGERLLDDTEFDGTGAISIQKRRGSIDIEADGWSFNVSFSSRGFNGKKWIKLRVGAPRNSEGITGLFGNINDKSSDDLVSRDGTFTVGPQPTVADIYDRFLNSWRITDDVSLLDYGAGETTATYTDLNFPRFEESTLTEGRDTPIDNIDLFAGLDTAKAEAVCRAAGVTAQPDFNDCVLDITLTGDVTLATDSQIAFAVNSTSRKNRMGADVDDGNVLNWWRTFPGQLSPRDGNLTGTDDLLLVSSANNDVEHLTALTPNNGDVLWSVNHIDASCQSVVAPSGNVFALSTDTSAAGGDVGTIRLLLIDGVSGVLLDSFSDSETALRPCAADMQTTSNGTVIHHTTNIRRAFRESNGAIEQVWTHEFVSDPMAVGNNATARSQMTVLQDDVFVLARETRPGDTIFTAYRIDGETGLTIDRLALESIGPATMHAISDDVLLITGAETGGTGFYEAVSVGTADAPALAAAWIRRVAEPREDGFTRFSVANFAIGDVGFSTWSTVDGIPTVATFDPQTGDLLAAGAASSFANNTAIAALSSGQIAVSPFGSENFVETFSTNGDFGWAVPYPTGADFPTGMLAVGEDNLVVVSRRGLDGTQWLVTGVGTQR